MNFRPRAVACNKKETLMRQLKALVLLAFVVSLSGCTVPTTYSKSIVVRKDATGKVIEIVETEAVVQPGGYGYPVQFEHLKDIKPVNSWQGKEEADSGQSGYEFRKKSQ